MKKITLIAALCCFTIMFSGCESIKDSKSANADLSESSAETTSENDSSDESSGEELSSRDRDIDTDSEYVFDDAKILSDSQRDEINTYAAWISRTFKINAGVVTTDDIGDSKPSEYAEEYYNDLYSGNGILFLVNNDTGNDCFYRKGFPSKFITDSDIEMLFAEISPMIVTGDYYSAIENVLETAELKLPEYLTDSTNTLEKKDISDINEKIKDAAGDNSMNLFLTGNTGDSTTEDYARELFSKYYDKNSDSAMLVVNINDGSSYICASGNLKYMTDKQEDIQSEIKKCINSDDSSFDASKAADSFISLIDEG